MQSISSDNRHWLLDWLDDWWLLSYLCFGFFVVGVRIKVTRTRSFLHFSNFEETTSNFDVTTCPRRHCFHGQ